MLPVRDTGRWPSRRLGCDRSWVVWSAPRGSGTL